MDYIKQNSEGETMIESTQIDNSPNIFESFSHFLGIEESVLGIIICVLTILLLGINTFQLTGTISISCLITPPISLVFWIMGLIPIWMIGIFTLLAIIIHTSQLYSFSPTSEHFNWNSYGERVKQAYSAKYFGENSGFNEEVDVRIKIMRETDKGIQRELAKAWLRRKSRWLELKWLKLDSSNYQK